MEQEGSRDVSGGVVEARRRPRRSGWHAPWPLAFATYYPLLTALVFPLFIAG